MSIRNRDLNLLYLFAILYRERNLSRAANLMNLSQPALSHKLNKLRHDFSDPLFVRTGRGLMPTPKADQLASQIEFLISGLERFYAEVDDTDFQGRTDHIHIYTTDMVEYLLLPKLLRLAHERAPAIRIVTHNTSGKLPATELANGTCDIAIAGFYRDLPGGLHRATATTLEFTVLYSKGNPYCQQPMTLDVYLKCPHLVTTLDGDLFGIVDRRLEALGKTRTVVAGASSFIALPHLMQQSPWLLTCLSPISDYAMTYCPDLDRQSPPLELDPIHIDQVWHPRTHGDPLYVWLRRSIRDILDV